MDGTASPRGEKAPPPNGDDGTASKSSVKVEQKQQPEPSPAVVHGGAAVKVEAGGEEDEQVERFFALLANIRALRAMYGGGTGSAECRGRKRARDVEPPWRPAFRLEDFQEQEAGAAGREEEGGGNGRREAADGETTRGPDGPSGRCVAARR